MFYFSRANHASTNLKKALSWKIRRQVYFIYPFPRRLKLGKSLETCCVNFFRLSWHFKREKPVFWKASFLQNKDWLHVQVREQDFATGQNFSFNQCSKQAREFCFFLSGKLFHKSNKKLFYMRLHILNWTLLNAKRSRFLPIKTLLDLCFKVILLFITYVLPVWGCPTNKNEPCFGIHI